MSEEFSFSASFSMPVEERMTTLATVLEHLDLYEADEARDLLQQHHLGQAQNLIESLTSPQSCYSNQADLINMFLDTFDDSVQDHQLSIEENGFRANITLEGHDHEADDACASLVLLLIALGAQRIQAQGGSPYWFAQYTSDNSGNVVLKFETE